MAYDIVTRPAAAHLGASVGARLGRALRGLQRWQQRARQRREAAWLTERDLADIGVSRFQLEIELAKPFWRR